MHSSAIPGYVSSAVAVADFELTAAELYITKKAAAKLSAALKLLSDAKYAVNALPPELLDTLDVPNAIPFLTEVMNRVAEVRSRIAPKPLEEKTP